MSKIIYGNLELNNKIYPFLLDGHQIHIVQQAYQNSNEDFEIKVPFVKGVTSDNRDILFLNCRLVTFMFNSKVVYSIQGYAISSSNTGEPCDFSFDRMTFYSDAINTFYSPQNAIDRESSWHNLFDQEWNGSMTIMVKPFSETDIVFEFDETTKCQLNISRYMNLRDGIEKIGDLRTSFSYVFSKKQTSDDISRYYLYLLDFLSFVNFNTNISFNEIFLENKDSKDKYSKTARVIIFNNATEYEGNPRNTITLDDLTKDKIGSVFKRISLIRNNDNRLYLYFPKNLKERNTVDPQRWLTAAICFEGLFTEINPDFKNDNEKFQKVKALVIKTVESIDSATFTTNKEKKYLADFKNHIERYDGFLEEKFNSILKSNKKVLNISSKQNYGKVYAEYRNKLAHGTIEPLDDKKIEVYKLLRPMVYILILNNIRLEEKALSNIINKLFF